jgi:transposase
VSRKIEARKKEALLTEPSKQQKKSSLKLAKQHARIAHLRADFSHQLTT